MRALPPGPGNLLLASMAYLRDPYGSMLENARRYGEPFTWPSFLGNMVITGDPVGVRTLLTAPAETYAALGAELLGPVLGTSNLILLSGDRHRAMRKLQSPPFQGSRLRVYGPVIVDVAVEHLGRLPRNRGFSAHRTMQEITLDVIMRAVLGLAEPGPRERFKSAVLALVASLKPSFMFFPRLRHHMGGLSAWARFKRAGERVTALFKAELDIRRSSAVPREDILGALMAARREDGSALPDDEILQQVMNLIGAGHETTASSLAWALHHIHRNPEIKQRLDAELAALPPGPLDPEAVVALPYLDAVCLETLRLNPVAALVGRTLREGLALQGYDLPPGTPVGVGIVNVHRRPDLYPEPERFVPDRFLGRTYDGFQYLPFGGGARRCLGAAFALYEMKLVLVTTLRMHRLRLGRAGPIRPVLRNTTVGPGGGVTMHLD